MRYRQLAVLAELPDHAGLPCQLIITMSLSDLERRAGLSARTPSFQSTGVCTDAPDRAD